MAMRHGAAASSNEHRGEVSPAKLAASTPRICIPPPTPSTPNWAITA